ncbi:MAG: hypothetical protein HKO87_02210 [Acidimicrobiia bacterium]|nr:hypothetical protein [Acidimicrobiia bacterium]
MRKGDRVSRLTKKVGQHGETGRIIEIRGTRAEVDWDDGHHSVVDVAGLHVIHEPAKKK